VSKTSRNIEFELPHIPDDCIRVEIKAVNDLPQAAGRDVYVQFSLSFPASAPHEAQTEPIRIQSDAPHTSGSLDPSRVYQFKLQRSRGTLRLFEIKKASFEVWRPGTLFRNPELIARGYQGLVRTIPLEFTSSVAADAMRVANSPLYSPNAKSLVGSPSSGPTESQPAGILRYRFVPEAFVKLDLALTCC